MLLHEIPKGSKLELYTSENEDEAFMDTFIFSHLDGMYSYIFKEDDPTVVVHLSRFTPLIKVGDAYQLAPEEDDEPAKA